MSVRAVFHGVTGVKFEAWRYREVDKENHLGARGYSGGWLDIEIMTEGTNLKNAVSFHTSKDEVMDHFIDILRWLNGPLRPEGNGAGESEARDVEGEIREAILGSDAPEASSRSPEPLR